MLHPIEFTQNLWSLKFTKAFLNHLKANSTSVIVSENFFQRNRLLHFCSIEKSWSWVGSNVVWKISWLHIRSICSFHVLSSCIQISHGHKSTSTSNRWLLWILLVQVEKFLYTETWWTLVDFDKFWWTKWTSQFFVDLRVIAPLGYFQSLSGSLKLKNDAVNVFNGSKRSVLGMLFSLRIKV